VLCPFLGSFAWQRTHSHPPVGLLGFHLVSIFGTRLRLLPAPSGFGWIAHAAYIGGALGTLFFTQQFVWLGFVAGLTALWLRLSGRAVPRFGLALVGPCVSLLAGASMVFLYASFRHVG
jgi:hypothetical protein